MKTRTSKAGKTADGGAEKAKTAVNQSRSLAQTLKTPPNLFILPKGLCADARIITISASSSTKSSRFLVCPDRNCFEFTNVGQDRAYRSWLLTPDDLENAVPDHASTKTGQGYVLRRPDLLIATPIDPLFILLPMMVGSQDNQNSYLTCSDYIFNAELQGHGQLQQLLRQPAFARLLDRFENRMIAISDSISLGDGDDAMYRLSLDKLTNILTSKAKRMAENGLPASLEQRYVRQALEVPDDHIEQDPLAAVESQIETDTGPCKEASRESASSDSIASSVSTAATSVSSTSDTMNAPSAEIVRLLRIRTAWDYMLRSYVSPTLHTKLSAALQRTSVDFKPLVEHEERINGIRQKAQALRTLSDNISRKRTLDDDETAAKIDEKRRKKEEEEQRKKSISHGVKKLMKADTSGMKKLSSFFTKGPKK